MKPFSYTRPADDREALALLSATKRPKGGGYDLLDLAKRGVSTPEVVVDLSRIKHEIVPFDGTYLPEGGQLEIGARMTLAKIADSPDVARICPALADAAREAATPQVRNSATIGGNLLQRPRCAYFRDPFFDCLKRGGTTCPARDGVHDDMAVFGNGKCCATHPSNLATALVALEGHVGVIRGIDAKGKPLWETYELESFFVRPEEDPLREARIAPTELMSVVFVPAWPASAYVEVNHKQSYDWAQAACAAALEVEGGKIARARIVLGAVAPIPWRVEAAEAAITGKSAGDKAAIAAAGEAAAQGATPLRDNAHKVRLVKVVVRRAIEAALARAL